MNTEPRPRFVWLKFEPSEIIELKRLVMDRDATAATILFQRVIAPRALEVARRRGILDECPEQEVNSGNLSR
jgi:hypothetical protein